VKPKGRREDRTDGKGLMWVVVMVMDKEKEGKHERESSRAPSELYTLRRCWWCCGVDMSGHCEGRERE